MCLSHCSRAKELSVKTSAICLVVSTNLIDLDPCVKADAVKQPIERNAMSPGNMSLNTRTSQVEHDFTVKFKFELAVTASLQLVSKPLQGLQHFAILHWTTPNVHFM